MERKTKNKTSSPARHNGHPEHKSAKDSALMDLFHMELKDIYWAEKYLLKNMPKMAKACTSKELREAFEKHMKETEGHIDRLEKVFELIGEKASGKRCDAMQSLIEEAEDMIDESEGGSMARDAALIFAAQKVEHYEIAAYGTLRVYAQVLDQEKVADLLAKTLEEEKSTDTKLTTIAEGFVNESASMEKTEE